MKYGNSPILLFLDYDGTLTPIVKRPELARPRSSTKKLLERLSKRVNLCIISGRSLSDIKNMVKIPGVIYAGNHGMEIDCYGEIFIHPAARRFRKKLNRIKKVLKNYLGDIPGILIEDKGLTLSVHYRNVERKYMERIKKVFRRPFGARITYGKKVFEVSPPVQWNKGMAARKIIQLSRQKVLPIYIGDDVTDEDAFEELRNRGITIFVGRPKKSYAEYFVWNVKEVVKFLGLLC